MHILSLILRSRPCRRSEQHAAVVGSLSGLVLCSTSELPENPTANQQSIKHTTPFFTVSEPFTKSLVVRTVVGKVFTDVEITWTKAQLNRLCLPESHFSLLRLVTPIVLTLHGCFSTCPFWHFYIFCSHTHTHNTHSTVQVEARLLHLLSDIRNPQPKIKTCKSTRILQPN